MNKYDWDTIATEYIQGYFVIDPETGLKKQTYPSADELSAKYGCSASTLKIRCSQEKWVEQRKIFQAKVRQFQNERKITTYLSESAKIDALTLLHVESIYKLLDYKLHTDYAPVVDRADNASAIDPDELAPINVTDLKTMISLLREAHTLVRNVVGEPVQSDAILKELNSLSQDAFYDRQDAAARKQKIKRLESTTKATESRIQELQKQLKEYEQRSANTSSTTSTTTATPAT